MKQTTPKKTKPKTPRARRGGKAGGHDRSRATTDDFEREDMGIAPKE